MLITGIQLSYDDDEQAADRVARVVDLIGQHRSADLIVLPELWMPTGFGYRRWADLAESVDGPTMQAIGAAAADANAVVHAGSIIERDGEALFNTSVVFGPDGTRLATYRKIHRFGFSAGEPALLEPGETVVVTPLPIGGATVPTGLATCYDLRFPEQFRALQERGAELVLIVAAWPTPRVEHWRLLLRARAIENQQVVVAVNTAGRHAGSVMGGHSAIVGPDGSVLAEAGPEEEAISAQVDPAWVPQLRKDFPVLLDRRPSGTFASIPCPN